MGIGTFYAEGSALLRRVPGENTRRKLGRCRRKGCRASGSDGVDGIPWHVGTYYSKRKKHQHDVFGRIPEDEEENVVQPLFDEQAQEMLSLRVVAREADLEEQVVASRLSKLRSLLPDMGSKWTSMKTADLVRLALDVEGVAKALVRIKVIFPDANVSAMVSRQPALLYWDGERLEEAKRQAKALLPNVQRFDHLVERNPLVLNVSQLEAGMKELKRLMPKQNIENMLERDPSLLLNVQSGSDMIPYDNGSLEQLEQTLRGGPDAAPPGW